MIKKLAINFSSLTILQISNYVIPLITFPYLVRVLGPTNFGLANFAFAFLVYFNTVIEFGFNFSSTREIAQLKDDKNKINQLFNLTFFSKIILLIPISILYFILISIIPFFSENYLIYTIAFLSIIGNLLFPVWFFQGIEKMYYITIFNIFFRIIGVVFIFLFVIEEKDLITYLLITSGVLVLTGAFSIYFLLQQKLVDLAIPKFASIKQHLSEGFNLFSSQYLIMLYTTSNTFILGLISGNTAVGFFTGADKIRSAVQNIGGIAGQTIFPHISNLFRESKVSTIKFLKKYLIVIGIPAFLLSTFLFLFSEELILLILGEQYLSSVQILKWLAYLPFIIFLSNVFGIQFMLGQGFDSEFRKIIFIGAILNLLLLINFVPRYGAEGTAASMLITEIAITLLTFAFVIRHKNEI
ncbi:MAG: flippase [Melioribacteraceae bacterium]|nr:MAG: flippase [Melioribacteraceae bacterium]